MTGSIRTGLLNKDMSVSDGGNIPGGGIKSNRKMRNLVFSSVPSFPLHALGL